MKRIYPWSPGTSTPDIRIIRSAGNAIASYFTNGWLGRFEGEPVFEWVTEKRVSLNTMYRRNNPNIVPYFSCGDLCHATLFCLGCRDETLVNRTGDEGKIPWVVGVNISRIVRHPAFKMMKPENLKNLGKSDILCLRGETQGTEHVCVFDGIDNNHVLSYDYGQVTKGRNSGIQCSRPITVRNGKVWLGDKFILGYLRLELIQFTESCIVPDDFAEGYPDDNPYYDFDYSRLLPNPGLVPIPAENPPTCNLLNKFDLNQKRIRHYKDNYI